MGYEEHLPTIVPPWLGGPYGKLYWGKVGALLDSVRQRLIDATKARFASKAAADSLGEIGRDRGLPQGAGETLAAYALRLIGAWTAWEGDDTPVTGVGGGAGSHLGTLVALELLGLPVGANGMTIVQQNGRYAQLSSGGALVLDASTVLMNCINRVNLLGAIQSRPGWTFEGRDNFYSEFGLLFPVDVPALTAGSALATALNSAVQKWKPGKMVFVGTWIIQSGITLGWPLGRTLGTDPNLGGNVIRYIPPAGGNRIGYSP